jgi:hypothetical protein
MGELSSWGVAFRHSPDQRVELGAEEPQMSDEMKFPTDDDDVEGHGGGTSRHPHATGDDDDVEGHGGGTWRTRGE